MGSLSAGETARRHRLQIVGVLSGLTAGAWLGAAEAPTKLVIAGLSPILVSFCMVIGVFLARWSAPALVRGLGAVGDDARRAPHLIVWGVLAGCLWAVANTLTVYAIRDVGLSIAFPLWNTNGVIGMLWGVLFFGELRSARRARQITVVAGVLVLFVAALLIAEASAAQAPRRDVAHGIAAALAAGVLWGTMYIPYRKAYLTGMNPLSFLTFFTIGEVVTMSVLALGESGGVVPLWHALTAARSALFWLLLGGFVWVLGDLAQQYAVKYIGISRGIPLSNTNQLWGLLWGVLVFGELRGTFRHRAPHGHWRISAHAARRGRDRVRVRGRARARPVGRRRRARDRPVWRRRRAHRGSPTTHLGRLGDRRVGHGHVHRVRVVRAGPATCHPCRVARRTRRSLSLAAGGLGLDAWASHAVRPDY